MIQQDTTSIYIKFMSQMVVITGYLRQPDQVSKTETMARGTKVLFAATSDRLPSQSTKDGRSTDRCFSLIKAHQCGILMVDARSPAASKSTTSETLVVSI